MRGWRRVTRAHGDVVEISAERGYLRELGGTPLELVVDLSFSVMASNSYGRVTNSYKVTVVERPQGPPVFLTTNLPNGVVNAPYSQQIVITNGGSFSISDGSLPAGLNMDTNGLISGIPTTAETLQFIVLATNVVGGSNKTFGITIDPPAGAPEFTTTSPLPSGVVGQPYSLQIEASNYPTNFSLLAGGLPEPGTPARRAWRAVHHGHHRRHAVTEVFFLR